MQEKIHCERCGREIDYREPFSEIQGKSYCLDCEKKVIKELDCAYYISEDYDAWLHLTYTFHSKVRLACGFFVFLFFIASVLSVICGSDVAVTNTLSVIALGITADFVLASINRRRYIGKLNTYLKDNGKE